jgi:hypothetical protein
MSNKEVITVIGATGAQGGGLCAAILNDPQGGFACRAITRDPGKDKARALAAKGADVVAADLDDVERLTQAFRGAHGAYCVTNFWQHFSAEKEHQQAKNLAEAADAAGVMHVIWSTLEDTGKLPITYHAADADAYRAFGFPGADEIGNMCQMYRDFETAVMGLRTPALTRELNPELLTFDQWAEKNKSKFPL